jgi:S-formylglutathione hydrolase FrmB
VRAALGVLLAALALVAAGCGSSNKPAAAPKVTQFQLNSKLMGRPLYETLVTPAGGGNGRPLLVFLHGYGAAPSDTVTPDFLAALRRLGDRAPVVMLPEGDTGWWHDGGDGPWGSYVLHEVIPAALRRTGADPHRVAIGGISMGGFGALDLGRLDPGRFCAVGGHSPAVLTSVSEAGQVGFGSAAEFRHHNLLAAAQRHSPFRAPVWIDIGDHDFLRPGATKLAHELQADGAKVSFHVWPGIHNGAYWDAHFAQYLDFYADACG